MSKCILTYGEPFDPFVQADVTSGIHFDWRDIAQNLTNTMRYSGAGRGGPLSVGVHSAIIAFIAANSVHHSMAARAQLVGLLHDAPEYVLNDLTRTVKPHVGGAYRDAEKRMTATLFGQFGLYDAEAYKTKQLEQLVDFIDKAIMTPLELAALRLSWPGMPSAEYDGSFPSGDLALLAAALECHFLWDGSFPAVDVLREAYTALRSRANFSQSWFMTTLISAYTLMHGKDAPLPSYVTDECAQCVAIGLAAASNSADVVEGVAATRDFLKRVVESASGGAA